MLTPLWPLDPAGWASVSICTPLFYYSQFFCFHFLLLIVFRPLGHARFFYYCHSLTLLYCTIYFLISFYFSFLFILLIILNN